MSTIASRLPTLSPLKTSQPRSHPSPPPEPADRVELGASTPPSPRRWKAVAFGALLGASTLAGALASPAGQALVQQVLQTPPPSQSLVEQLQGYAGELSGERQQVVETVLENFERFDAPTSRARDGILGYPDLHRVAADSQAEPLVRESAQALLADPVLFDSLDVAWPGARKVDGRISTRDLEQAIDYEQGGDFGSFYDVSRRLENPLVFDYLDSLGNSDEAFTWDDVQGALNDEQAPEAVRQAARELTSNRNYFNALDVAHDPHPGLAFGHRRDGVVSAEDLQEIAYSPLPQEGRQFGDEQHAALARALRPGFGADVDWIEGFSQTYRGNCATTALLKIALAEYGPQLLAEVRPLDSGGYRLRMRDGFELTVSDGELEAAATAASYQGSSPEARALATLGYAAMAKRAWSQGHEGAQSYGQALLSLANGENTLQVAQYLGLSQEVEVLDLEEVRQQPRAVVFGSGHAYYVEQREGTVVGDRWGQARPYQGRVHIDEGKPQESAFRLRS